LSAGSGGGGGGGGCGGTAAIESRDILKTYFETGDVPTEDQFADLIDSYIHQIDDGVYVYASMRDRINALESKLQAIGLLARYAPGPMISEDEAHCLHMEQVMFTYKEIEWSWDPGPQRSKKLFVGGLSWHGGPEPMANKEKGKDKDKDKEVGKKEYVGHVTLLK
jgi:hypothetical protein